MQFLNDMMEKKSEIIPYFLENIQYINLLLTLIFKNLKN